VSSKASVTKRAWKWLALAATSAITAPAAAPSQTQAAELGSIPALTHSYYERSANWRTLYTQGARAGRRGEEGLVILDFGRPATNGTTDGTMSFSGHFISLAAVQRGVEGYIVGYFRHAPAATTLDVAIGTNNSCGTGQPCGSVARCGCPDEPADFATWGRELALVVEQVRSWALSYRAYMGFTDDVRVVAADDAEPAFDPGYHNTYALLAGYSRAVGGSQPAMVDYGSAEPHHWTEKQLLQVAYGFAPDVPMPEIYYPAQVAEWAQLVRWAKAAERKSVTIYGVLSGGRGVVGATRAYQDLLRAVATITRQSSIPWLSVMSPLPKLQGQGA
jgi:hypothetical protein